MDLKSFELGQKILKLKDKDYVDIKDKISEKLKEWNYVERKQ